MLHGFVHFALSLGGIHGYATNVSQEFVQVLAAFRLALQHAVERLNLLGVLLADGREISLQRHQSVADFGQAAHRGHAGGGLRDQRHRLRARG